MDYPILCANDHCSFIIHSTAPQIPFSNNYVFLFLKIALSERTVQNQMKFNIKWYFIWVCTASSIYKKSFLPISFTRLFLVLQSGRENWLFYFNCILPFKCVCVCVCVCVCSPSPLCHWLHVLCEFGISWSYSFSLQFVCTVQ